MGDEITRSLPEEYVLLALRLGAHVEGLIDTYIGPTALADRVRSESLQEPRALGEKAARLQDALARSPLEEPRTTWFEGQLSALSTVALRLEGQDMAWVEEVKKRLGVQPTVTPTRIFQEVHSRLDSVVPGEGDLRNRYVAWKKECTVPTDAILPAVEALSSSLRERSRELVGLGEQEEVTYHLVTDKPWLAYNWYLGDLRSRIEINTDLPLYPWTLPFVVAHEAYPGHHTERALKEQKLLRREGHLETSVVVVGAPESLICEGIAMIALEQAFDNPHEHTSASLASVGLSCDPQILDVVHEVESAFVYVMTNAAQMLHEERVAAQEVEEYLKTWALASDEEASKLLEFISDETWRAYAPAYSEGRSLCQSFANTKPDGFRRLLTEQLTTAHLLT